ncbi:hypothetical protein CBS101457_005937 [Exobasidium rhododendri]|nr:hypothetical protein CBS101457_005937 [Exobasidium rhododendri]
MAGSSKEGDPRGLLDPGQYASLALTHVQYHPGDPFAMPLSLITLAPPFLLVSYITLLLVRRELTMLTALIGQLGCEGLNLALKRIFKQGRPTDFLGTGYGMPSSHSQFMGYFMAFWCLHLYRFRPGLTRARRSREEGQRIALSLIGVLRSAEHLAAIAFIVALSLITAYSRYHLSYHTPLQILVGFSVGVAAGLAWNTIVEISLSKPIFGMSAPLREIVLNNPLFVAFRVRDSWAVWDDGGMEGEYGFWKREWERRRAEDHSQLSRSSTEDSIHVIRLLQALQSASKCDETTAAFSVGCVIALSSSGDVLSTGYSREEPGNTHAEEVALNRLIREQRKSDSSEVLELDLYTTMEPCSTRLSKKASCVERVLDFNALRLGRDGKTLRIVRIFQGVREPEDFVKCVGTRLLESNGLEVVTVTGPIVMKKSTTKEEVQLASGWLEREAIRLAKAGHADQKPSQANEAMMWSQAGWVPSSAKGHSTRLRRREKHS